MTTTGDMPTAEDDNASVLARRRRWVAIVAAGAVLLAGAGVGASLLIKSPAQAAADARAPSPDILTSPVEHRVLKDSVILRGTVTAGQSVDVTPADAGGEDGGRPVVTKLPLRQGQTVAAGQVVMEVSGRPVFALKGSVPVYRDLKPGTEGDDVKQLQKALTSLGHRTGNDRAGHFGAGTKSALNAYYASIGYDPLPASADEADQISAAQSAVTAAERAHEDALDTLHQATAATGSSTASGSTAAPSPSASATLSAADRADGKTVPGSAGSGGGDGTSGGAETRSLRKGVSRAAEDLATAREALNKVKQKAGPMLPSGEVVFIRSFPARVTQVSAVVGSGADGAAMKISAGQLVVDGYLQEQQKGLIRSGQKVRIDIESAGLTVPATVTSVADSQDNGQQATGQSGTDGSNSGDTAGSGTGSGTGGAASVPQGYLMVVHPNRPLPSNSAGEDVRLTIEAASTSGAALVVPVTALSSGADGKSVVTVLEAGDGQQSGRQRRVAVRPGTSGDGFVAVTPEAGASLKEGDLVITGVKKGAGSGS
ncbi:peptidoglycan-binding domain-containing protein [Streptomyces sp. NPDC006552]|uniref:peptidoglycan-binding domain-containing protein n=1 Tax=Streptomyces sp. NPDC006552 TaxID=3157179 RepID=UPI0033B3340E